MVVVRSWVNRWQRVSSVQVVKLPINQLMYEMKKKLKPLSMVVSIAMEKLMLLLIMQVLLTPKPYL